MAFDPDYASVSLLLHGDGANGSTTFTDSGPAPNTFTAYGNAQISTTHSVFGGASMYFDGVGDWIDAPDAEAFSFGSGDWTVEARIKSPGNGSFDQILGQRNVAGSANSDSPIGLVRNATTGALIATVFSQDLGANVSITSAMTTVYNDTWRHIAVVRIGTSLKLFIDGVIEATGSISGPVSNSTTKFSVGRAGEYAGQYYKGYIDELRISKGVARYTSNFTPPAEAFANTATPPVVSAHAAAVGPLGGASILGGDGVCYASAAAAGPLASPAILANCVQAARAIAEGPLGAPSLLCASLAAAYAAAAGPLGLGSASASLPPVGWAGVQSPLGVAALVGHHDFTGQLGDAVTLYVMDLITPAGTVRVPVSSWQATLQTGSSNYVQCVIPACGAWVDALNAATEFIIYRRAVLGSGLVMEYEMARSPAEHAQFDRGPQRYTCTLSGYSAAFAESLDPLAAYDRTLSGVRSTSSGASNFRVRCAIDWLLRPGQRAIVQGTSFVVRYINYYAPSVFDSYMDVGA